MTDTKAAEETIERVVYEDPTLFPIRSLRPHPDNPRMGDVDAIVESLIANGQYKPVIIQRRPREGKTDELRMCAGHHTVKAAKQLGWKKVGGVVLPIDDEEAERILLVDNFSADKGGYSMDVVAEILERRQGALAGTGFTADDARALTASIQDRNQELLAATMNKPVFQVEMPDLGDDEDEDFEAKVGKAQEATEGKRKAVKALLGQDVATDYRETAAQDEELAGLQERFEGILQRGWDVESNYWGISELREDMLIEAIPDKIDTWARWDVTPDDGETTWVYNYGVTNATKLPWERTMLSFFTYDEKFEVWWNDPSYRTAMAYMAGCRQAIVPDYSMFGTDARFLHLQAHYKSMWLGRFFQECGMRVMPRLHFHDIESLRYAMAGIPIGAPAVAVCFQAGGTRNPELAHEATETYEAFRLMVKELKPESILLYGGNPALKIVEKAHLPKSIEVVHIENFAAKRRGSVFDVARGKDAVSSD